MAAIRLKYTLRDVDRHGRVRWYLRRAGARKVLLNGEPGSVAFAQSYQAALRAAPTPAGQAQIGRPVAAKGTVAWLVEQYYQSAAFRACAARTRHVRELVLRPVVEQYGVVAFAAMKPAVIRSWRDASADRPESANALVKALRQVYAYAVEYDHMENNPAASVPYLVSTGDGHHRWTAAEIARFERRHPVGTKARLAMALLLYTGQRRSDVTRLGQEHFRAAGWLTLTQHKNRERKPVTLDIPVLPELQAVLDGSQLGSPTYLVTEFGKPFSDAGFGNWFRERCNEAGLAHCSAHGLRKASASLLAESGATAHEIMSITGHRTMKEVERYTRQVHQRQMAESAMRRLTIKRT